MELKRKKDAVLRIKGTRKCRKFHRERERERERGREGGREGEGDRGRERGGGREIERVVKERE